MLVGRGAAHSGVLAAARLSSVVCAARGERERERGEAGQQEGFGDGVVLMRQAAAETRGDRCRGLGGCRLVVGILSRG